MSPPFKNVFNLVLCQLLTVPEPLIISLCAICRFTFHSGMK